MKRLLLTVILITIATFCSLPLRAQDVQDGVSLSDSELPTYVVLVTDVEDSTQMTISDAKFNEMAGRVIFKVNRTELRLGSPLLKELQDKVFPIANSKSWRLLGIDLRGAASPEGPYWNNVRLSKGRAKALRDYLSEHLDSVAVSDINERTTAEDYDYLLWLMQREGDLASPTVETIIRECGGDEARIKARLQRIDGGQLWARLLKEYYPEVRAARLVLYFQRLHIEPTILPEKAVAILPVLPDVQTATCAVQRKEPEVLERRHVLSLSTNLLYDAFYMPDYGMAPVINIAAEYFPKRGNWTFRFQFTTPYYHKWDKHQFFQIRDYHFELRRYFRPKWNHTGAYLGVYANNTIYGIGLSETKGWEGEGLGGALKFGYVAPLGKGRWRLDFHIAAGGYYTRFDPYVWGNPITGEIDDKYYYDWVDGPSSFRRRNHQLTWLGPTEVGITLSYDLFYRRIKKHGWSMKRKEVVR